MNLNGKALGFSSLFSLLQSIAVTYYATTPHPGSWVELVRIEFVMAWLISFSGVTVAAHMNFRGKDARSRSTDVENMLKSLEDTNDFKGDK